MGAGVPRQPCKLPAPLCPGSPLHGAGRGDAGADCPPRASGSSVLPVLLGGESSPGTPGRLDILSPSPPDYPDPDSFCWERYLEETGASAVPTWAFKVVSWLSLPPELSSGRRGVLGQLGCGPAPRSHFVRPQLPRHSTRTPFVGPQHCCTWPGPEGCCPPAATPAQLSGQHEAGGCGPQEPSPDPRGQRGGCGGPSDKGGSGTPGLGQWTGRLGRDSVA